MPRSTPVPDDSGHVSKSNAERDQVDKAYPEERTGQKLLPPGERAPVLPEVDQAAPDASDHRQDVETR